MKMAVCDTLPVPASIPPTPQQVNDLEQRTLNNIAYVGDLIAGEENQTIKRFYQVLFDVFKRQEESVRFEAFVKTVRLSVYDPFGYEREEERKKQMVASHYEQMANDFYCVASLFSDLRKHNLWRDENHTNRQIALTKGLGELCSLAWQECANLPEDGDIRKLDVLHSTRRQMYINLMELSFPLKK